MMDPKEISQSKKAPTSADQVSQAQSFSSKLNHKETHCLGDVCIMVRVRGESTFAHDMGRGGSKVSNDPSLEEYARQYDAFKKKVSISEDNDYESYDRDDNEQNDDDDDYDEEVKRTDVQSSEFAVDDCAYFMDPISFAKELVNNIIQVSETKAEIKSPCPTEKAEEIKDDQQSLDFMFFRESSDDFTFIETKKLQVKWPTIHMFTAELGVDKILEYLGYFDVDEDWTFIVYYLGLEQCQCSDLYKYQAIYSLPTWKYPIAQATASIYFTIEVCRSKPRNCLVDVTFQYETFRQIHKPGISDFNEKWLHYILDSKIKFFQTVTY